jgi:undecaprenyl-diphosphatase
MSEQKYEKPAVLFQVVLVLLAGAFAGLTFLVETTPSLATDLKITAAVQSINSPFFAWLMTAVSWAGFFPQAMAIAGLTILVIYALGLHWEAVMAIVAAAVSSGGNLLVKELVQRPRPLANLVHVADALHSYSFPSGHVMYYLGFWGFISFLVFSLLEPSLKRNLLLVLMGIPIWLIGISRIYLGQHWASDVLGAYLLGSLFMIATIRLYCWGKTRF